jgi:hypothetical protein
MSPSGVRQELGRRLSGGRAGNSLRADASRLCLIDILHLNACRAGWTDANSKPVEANSCPLPGSGGRFAHVMAEENLLYPRTELLHSEACGTGVTNRSAGRGRRNDAECRQ